MRKLQNSLYLTRDDLYAHKQREAIVVKEKEQTLTKIPIHAIGNIYCYGGASVSSALMKHCCDNDVNLAYFDYLGRFQARVQGRVSGNVLLRRKQYGLTAEESVSISKNIIAAKIQNTMRFLQRRIRNHGQNRDLELAITSLRHSLNQVKTVTSIEKMRGYEGEAASIYFKAFNHLLGDEQKKDFAINGRNRRPPKDPINALLSFLYAIIGQDISGSLSSVGLDPQIGVLHSDRPGRDSLSQDILEEFRIFLADQLAITLINRKQLKLSNFVKEASGAVSLSDKARKIIFNALQDRKKEKLRHPFLNEDVEIGLLPHIQAMLLSRHLRGDLAHYPPFLFR